MPTIIFRLFNLGGTHVVGEGESAGPVQLGQAEISFHTRRVPRPGSSSGWDDILDHSQPVTVTGRNIFAEFAPLTEGGHRVTATDGTEVEVTPTSPSARVGRSKIIWTPLP